jgi:hypothetical protein
LIGYKSVAPAPTVRAHQTVVYVEMTGGLFRPPPPCITVTVMHDHHDCHCHASSFMIIMIIIIIMMMIKNEG